MEWAEEQYRAETLSDCTTAVMDQYAHTSFRKRSADSTVRNSLHPLYRLSQMAKWLPPADRLVRAVVEVGDAGHVGGCG